MKQKLPKEFQIGIVNVYIVLCFTYFVRAADNVKQKHLDTKINIAFYY